MKIEELVIILVKLKQKYGSIEIQLAEGHIDGVEVSQSFELNKDLEPKATIY